MKTTLVRQDLYGKSYSEIVTGLNIYESQGGCCGWAEYNSTDFLENLSDDLKDSAKLISVVEIDYSDELVSSERRVCNFIFQTNDGAGYVLGYDLSAGSGSGWAYGACIDLNYHDSLVTSASW